MACLISSLVMGVKFWKSKPGRAEQINQPSFSKLSFANTLPARMAGWALSSLRKHVERIDGVTHQDGFVARHSKREGLSSGASIERRILHEHDRRGEVECPNIPVRG